MDSDTGYQLLRMFPAKSYARALFVIILWDTSTVEITGYNFFFQMLIEIVTKQGQRIFHGHNDLISKWRNPWIQ